MNGYADVLDPARLFHIGIVVTDLSDAMVTVGNDLGLTWSEPMVAGELMEESSGGLGELKFNFAYSREASGHVRTELVESIPGTIWESSPSPMHHLGYWSDDVDAEGRHLQERGFTMTARPSPKPGAERQFAYYRGRSGLYVELVSSTVRTALEETWR